MVKIIRTFSIGDVLNVVSEQNGVEVCHSGEYAWGERFEDACQRIAATGSPMRWNYKEIV